MNWVLSKKQMGLRRELACLSLLLLMLLLSENTSFADGYVTVSRLKFGSASVRVPAKPQGGLRGNANKEGDGIFVAEKRKVYTGPNPLHNR